MVYKHCTPIGMTPSWQIFLLHPLSDCSVTDEINFSRMAHSTA